MTLIISKVLSTCYTLETQLLGWSALEGSFHIWVYHVCKIVSIFQRRHQYQALLEPDRKRWWQFSSGCGNGGQVLQELGEELATRRFCAVPIRESKTIPTTIVMLWGKALKDQALICRIKVVFALDCM